VLNHLPLSLSLWQWNDLALSHVVHKLAWQLLKSFLGQQCRIMLEVIEGNELNNISGSVSSERLREQCLIITIKLVHHTEISVTNTHDDDRQRVV